MMGAVISSLFFLRFWQKTRDRLFLIFAIAFGLMGLERLVLCMNSDEASEHQAMVYLIRLSSFLLILYGIWDKNRPHRT